MRTPRLKAICSTKTEPDAISDAPAPTHASQSDGEIEARFLRRHAAFLAIGAAIAAISIVGIGLSLLMSLIALRLSAQGYSARAIGLQSAVAGLATLVSAPLAPLLARAFGLRRVLLATLVIGAASLGLFAITESFWIWLILRAIFGAVLTVLFVLSEYWINILAPPNRRGLIMGIYATTMALGFATGPTILAVTGIEGFLPFLIPIGLFAAAGLPILFGTSAAPPMAEEARHAKITAFVQRAPVASVTGFLHGAIEMAALGLLPVFALQAGLDSLWGARLVGIFALGNVLFQIPLGLASDHFERRRMLLAISLAGLATTLLLPLAGPDRLGLFCMLLVLCGGLSGSLYPIGLALLGSQYKGAELASANAAFVVFYSIGMVSGPPIIGFGMDLYAPNGFFLTIGCLFLIYALFLANRLTRGLE